MFLQQLTPSSGILTRVDRHMSSKSIVQISEPKYNVNMHFVVKTDFPDPDPECGIPDKWDKITLKKSVPKNNCPDTEASGYLASGYLRVHCNLVYTFGRTFLGHHNYTIRDFQDPPEWPSLFNFYTLKSRDIRKL